MIFTQFAIIALALAKSFSHSDAAPVAADNKRDVITPYVTVTPNGVDTPGADVSWKRWVKGPFVTVQPGEVDAPGATVTWKRDVIAPYVTVKPGEVEAPGTDVTWKKRQLTPEQLASLAEQSPDGVLGIQPGSTPTVKRDVVAPYVTVTPDGVEAPYTNVEWKRELALLSAAGSGAHLGYDIYQDTQGGGNRKREAALFGKLVAAGAKEGETAYQDSQGNSKRDLSQQQLEQLEQVAASATSQLGQAIATGASQLESDINGQAANKRQEVEAPYVTVGPNGVEAPYTNVQWRRDDADDIKKPMIIRPLPTGIPISPASGGVQPEQEKRQYYEGPYVTVGANGVDAPYATVSY